MPWDNCTAYSMRPVNHSFDCFDDMQCNLVRYNNTYRPNRFLSQKLCDSLALMLAILQVLPVVLLPPSFELFRAG